MTEFVFFYIFPLTFDINFYYGASIVVKWRMYAAQAKKRTFYFERNLNFTMHLFHARLYFRKQTLGNLFRACVRLSRSDFFTMNKYTAAHVCIYKPASVPSIQMENKVWHGKLLFYDSSLPFKCLFLRKESHLVSRILYRYFILVIHNILRYVLLV